MKTRRMSMAAAIIRFLEQQYVQRDGVEHRRDRPPALLAYVEAALDDAVAITHQGALERGEGVAGDRRGYLCDLPDRQAATVHAGLDAELQRERRPILRRDGA